MAASFLALLSWLALCPNKLEATRIDIVRRIRMAPPFFSVHECTSLAAPAHPPKLLLKQELIRMTGDILPPAACAIKPRTRVNRRECALIASCWTFYAFFMARAADC